MLKMTVHTKDGALVGSGYFVYRTSNKQEYEFPFMVGFKGEALPDDWYDVRQTGQEWPVWICETIQ